MLFIGRWKRRVEKQKKKQSTKRTRERDKSSEMCMSVSRVECVHGASEPEQLLIMTFP